MVIEVNNKSSESNNYVNSVALNTKTDNTKSFKKDLECAKNISVQGSVDDEKTKARKEDIAGIEEYYEEDKKNVHHFMQLLNTDIMYKVVDLHVDGNEKYYNNGKISIDKVAKDCGLSLDDISPKELNSIRQELNEEGLLDYRTNKDLENFIDRTYSNNRLLMSEKEGYSLYDFRLDHYTPRMIEICEEAYNQKGNCFEKCQYFVDLDKEFGQLLSQSAMENVMSILSNTTKEVINLV